jgi:hypothetical protein
MDLRLCDSIAGVGTAHGRRVYYDVFVRAGDVYEVYFGGLSDDPANGGILTVFNLHIRHQRKLAFSWHPIKITRTS